MINVPTQMQWRILNGTNLQMAHIIAGNGIMGSGVARANVYLIMGHTMRDIGKSMHKEEKVD